MSTLILVVEDNATTRKMLRLTLMAEGYAVAEAETGADALQIARAQTPALVVLDCRLPDLEGPEVCRLLHEHSPQLPVLAVTGWVHADDQRMLTSGFVDVLVKPVEPARMLEAIARYVERGQHRAPELGRRVLVIDDDAAQRKVAHLAFSAAGFTVVAASDGAAALQLARENPPDVFVSDVLMPGMDGFQLCAEVRRDPALARVPVVLVSAHYLEDEDRALAARFGANRYVSRNGGFELAIRNVLEVLESPHVTASAAADPDVQADYLRRIAHQLERQAMLGAGLARRASTQATALSVLDGISDALSRHLDPESALEETLTKCLDAAGLSVGAILLFDAGVLTLRAQVGASPDVWSRHAGWLTQAVADGGISLPSSKAGEAGDRLLQALGVLGALAVPIIARDETLGVLALASNRPDFGEPDESFLRAARSVSTQVGQALALGRMFLRVASAERRYRALLENARDAIGIVGIDGAILEANRGWEHLLGRDRSELVGRSLSDFVAPADRARDAAEHRNLVAHGGSLVRQLSLLHKDGQVRHSEVSRTVVDLGNETVVFAIGRDVSERVRLEEQLRQAQKMEAVGRLAGGIAHDMNNILAAVLSYGQFIVRALPTGTAEPEDAEEICKAAQRGAALTRQLLAFSRQQALRPRQLDLNDIVRNMLNMLRTLVGEATEFETNLAPDLPIVEVDAGHMEQVIMNLVVNARDAMPTGGKIIIATRPFRTGVRLSLSDSGTGMDGATRERVFEPFFTTKEEGRGTGLGLSTVFGIIQQSGGEISLETELGRGTTFHIDLPAAKQAETAAVSPVRAARTSGSETVLIVEDDDSLRAALVRTLKKNGYEVLAARTGADALEQHQSYAGTIDLVVTDVVMPVMSGAEMVHHLVAKQPDVRVLFMSGYTDTSAYRSVPVGGLSFLQKPFTPTDFAAKVRSVLDARSRKP